MSETALTVSGSTLYLLRDNTIYRFRATDLKLLGQGELPAPMLGRSAPPPETVAPAPPGEATPTPPGDPSAPLP